MKGLRPTSALVAILLCALAWGSAPSALADTPGTTLTVTPNTGLTDNQSVTVTGAGFGASVPGDVAECRHDQVANLDLCEATAIPFTADVNGNFTVTRAVRTSFLDAGNQTVACLPTNDCFLSAVGYTNGKNAARSITFSFVAAGRYTPLTPARILDTRNGTGGFSSPIGSGGTIDLQVTGQGGVPASGVSAVAMNVTVTNPTTLSFLTLYPTGQTRPLAANLNFVAGQIVPNLVVVKVGTGGKVSIFNNAGTADVIADVAGWFSDPSAGNDGRYQPVTPARILDTRDGHTARLNAGQSLDLQVTGQGGLPASGVSAVAMNVAVTGTNAQSFLTVYPTGTARPNAANLNWVSGLIVSNRVMVKLGTGGKVTIFNNAGSTDVVVDVNGWYTDATVAGTNGAYNALTPARILDTRDGTGGISSPVGPGATIDVQVTGRGGVPASGVSAVILNATVTQPSSASFFTIFPTGTAKPLAADLNFAPGENRPNLVVVKLGTAGEVSLFNQTGTAHVVFDVAGWFS